MTTSPGLLALLLAGWCGVGALVQDPAAKPPLGPGPAWRGPVRPTAHNEVFATADGCAMSYA